MELTQKYELKSVKIKCTKAQIQKYKTTLKLKSSNQIKNNKHHLELMTLYDKHDLTKLKWIQKFKMTQTKQITPIKNINKTQIKQKQNNTHN